MSWEPLDIEELHKVANAKQFCPYYVSKDRIQGADIIFMPYNYLIEEKMRESFNLELANTVLIFDEAHNISPASEECLSFELKASQLDNISKELGDLQDAKSQDDNKEWASEPDQLSLLRKFAEKFLSYMKNVSMDFNQHKNAIKGDGVTNNRFLPQPSVVIHGSEIFNIFEEGTSITHQKENQKVEEITIFSEWHAHNHYFENAMKDIQELGKNGKGVKTQLENWYDVLKKIARLRENK